MTDVQVPFVDPVEAYVSPIRSVLFIDDEFPVYGVLNGSAKEGDRARALWHSCTARGWMCDIDNRPDWTTGEQERRLTSCDLLVLDYHLLPGDVRPSLRIIRKLALSPAPNIVLIYTAESNLTRVLLNAAAAARGVASEPPSDETVEQLDTLDPVEWSVPDYVSYLQGKKTWMRTFSLVYSGPPALAAAVGEAALQQALLGGLELTGPQLRIEQLRCSDERYWFQAGNMFVVVVGKPTLLGEHDDPTAVEDRALVGGLKAAVRDWNPPWLACLVAASRGRVQAGGFGDDVQLPDQSVQRGLMHYVQAAADPEEKARRANDIAKHLLSRRFESASRVMGRQLASGGVEELRSTAERISDLLNLNAFLCSETFDGHHLTTGTVFREKGRGKPYWVCVTPACDMVPRLPSKSLNPWAHALDPNRPLLALQLVEETSAEERSAALAKAERGRHLFFLDETSTPSRTVVAAATNRYTEDPNPRLEQMWAAEQGRVTDGSVRLLRLARSTTAGALGLEIKPIECVVVTQLRPAYADRLTHMVGGHLSRVGVDFVRFNDPCEQGCDEPGCADGSESSSTGEETADPAAKSTRS